VVVFTPSRERQARGPNGQLGDYGRILWTLGDCAQRCCGRLIVAFQRLLPFSNFKEIRHHDAQTGA
jgi:hypothetical protein